MITVIVALFKGSIVFCLWSLMLDWGGPRFIQPVIDQEDHRPSKSYYKGTVGPPRKVENCFNEIDFFETAKNNFLSLSQGYTKSKLGNIMVKFQIYKKYVAF